MSTQPRDPNPEEEDPALRPLMTVIQTRYGDRLDEHQLDQVAQQLNGMLRDAAKLRSYPLVNADEPFSIFRPYRKEW